MRTVALTLSLAIGWLIADAGVAAEPCKAPAACTEVQTCGAADRCARCGRGGECEKQCRVVCEMKEVKKTVWVVKCEDFCAPLPNCGRGDCNGCGSCAAGETCGIEPSCNDKRIVPPKCGKVREKKTLEKKEIVCKVPVYKCVVVYSCGGCAPSQGCDGQPVTPAPAKPVTPAPNPGKTTLQAPLPPVMGASFVK